LAEALEKTDERESNLSEGLNLFAPMSTLDDWALGWFLTGAKMAGDQKKVDMANTERRRRVAGASDLEAGTSGKLPITAQGLQKVENERLVGSPKRVDPGATAGSAP